MIYAADKSINNWFNSARLRSGKWDLGKSGPLYRQWSALSGLTLARKAFRLTERVALIFARCVNF